MKKTLKFVNAGVFFLSLAFLFMNMVELAMWKFSGFNFIRIGFSGASGDQWLDYVLYYAQEYFQKFSILLIIIAVVAFLGIIFNCLLSGTVAHVLSIAMSFVDMLCVIILYVILVTNISQIDDVLDFLGAGSYTRIAHTTFILWIGAYLLIMVMSVVGLFARDKVKTPVKGEIYPEQFYGRKNALKKQPPVQQPPVQLPPLQNGPMQMDDPVKVNPVKPPVQEKPVRSYASFHGAIVGKNPIYAGKALMLEKATRVFFVEDEGNIVTSRYEDEQAVAEVYFADTYQEYCVGAMEKNCIYLASGQPLGKGRTYYLPRGTKLYVKDKKNMFELA